MIEIGNKTLVMGILNVTPDSFSDGGNFISREDVQSQVRKMLEAGADIIDVGGESTRPLAEAVAAEEEMRRVLPAIKAIRDISSIPVSIDTTKAVVATNALEEGANIINDISSLTCDPSMLDAVLSYDGPVIIMHMQGTPKTMQIDPQYTDVVEDICFFFKERISWLREKGVAASRIVIDPGIGFGKTVEQNLIILQKIQEFERFGCPVLVGHSRKSFLGKIFDLKVEDRDTVTAVISAICALNKVAVVRVHDVAASVQSIKVAEAILSA